MGIKTLSIIGIAFLLAFVASVNAQSVSLKSLEIDFTKQVEISLKSKLLLPELEHSKILGVPIMYNENNQQYMIYIYPYNNVMGWPTPQLLIRKMTLQDFIFYIEQDPDGQKGTDVES